MLHCRYQIMESDNPTIFIGRVHFCISTFIMQKYYVTIKGLKLERWNNLEEFISALSYQIFSVSFYLIFKFLYYNEKFLKKETLFLAYY